MNYEIGKITKDIIKVLGLDYNGEKTIYIGDSNINHIKERHFEDYIKYGNNIKEILKKPTYLARNERKNSIEFIKRYNDYVMVVVRVSRNNINFVRTMYVMDEVKVEKYFKHNYFYPYNT